MKIALTILAMIGIVAAGIAALFIVGAIVRGINSLAVKYQIFRVVTQLLEKIGNVLVWAIGILMILALIASGFFALYEGLWGVNLLG